MKRFVVDENGKVLDELYEGDKIRRKKQIDSYKKQLKRKEENMEGCVETMKFEEFGIVNIKEMKLLESELTIQETGVLMRLCNRTSYIDCCVMKNRETTANSEDLIEITKLSKPTLDKIIKTLIKKKLIFKGKVGYENKFFLNPWLFYRGDKINKTLKKMFNNYKIRSKGNIMWKNINKKTNNNTKEH